MNRLLPWIDNSKLEQAVSEMLDRAQKAKENVPARTKKNVVDPFSSLALALTIEIDKSDLLSQIQRLNSISQAISNAVGNFHQEVLGSVQGFRNYDAGYDLECQDKRIIAEVKNKHNTMNSSNRAKVVDDLDTAIRQKAGAWTAYLVVIIPRKPNRYKKKIAQREVYEVDGATFYELATGYPKALHDLYFAIEKIIRKTHSSNEYNEVFEYCEEALKIGVPQ